MKFVFRSLLLLLALAFIAGCASTKTASDQTDPNGQVPSTIPWNRPQSWEGTGMLGGAMGQ